MSQQDESDTNEQKIINKIKEIELYRPFFEYSMGKSMVNANNQFNQIYLRNLFYLNGMGLLKLYLNESNTFFDVPSAPSLLKIIYEDPKIIHKKYSPLFVQNLTFELSAALSNPETFALATIKYFYLDFSEIFVFSYCTFPSIFSHFIPKRQSSIALVYLTNFFKISPNFIFSSHLLTSYFNSAMSFYSSLWNFLSTRILSFAIIRTNEIPYQSFINMTYKSIQTALFDLSENHLKAFISFYDVFAVEPEFYDNFVNQILLEPFILQKDSLTLFPSNDFNDLYIKFLQNVNNEYKNDVISFVELFLNSPQNNNNNNRNELYPERVSHRNDITLLMSEYSIFQFTEIMSRSSDFNNYYDKKKKLQFTYSFQPYLIPFFPKLSKDNEFNSTCSELFGLKYPHIDQINESDDYSRLWKQISCKNNSINILNMINKYKTNQKLYVYLLNKLLEKYKTNFLNVEQAIIAQEEYFKLRNMNQALEIGLRTLFHTFSRKFIKDNLENNLRIKISTVIDSIVNDIKIPNDSLFDLFCNVLDIVEFRKGLKFDEIKNKFKNILNCWKENIWIKERKKYEECIKMKYLAIVSQTFSTLRSYGFGKRLKLIILFQKKLKVITDHVKNKMKSNTKGEISNFIFRTTLLFANCEDVLPTFLFLNHKIVFNNNFSRFLVLENQSKLWSKFANGIMSLIGCEKEFVKDAVTKVFVMKSLDGMNSNSINVIEMFDFINKFYYEIQFCFDLLLEIFLLIFLVNC